VNIREFYAASPVRRESEEVSFGAGWTEHLDPSATYRISWVQQTGEVYTVREPHPGGGLLAPVFDHYNIHQADVDELQVEILAVAVLPDVTDAMTGWREHVAERDSLEWARDRLAALAPRTERS
jgi:hypothetical protein